ncbi:MAG: DUF5011 domain-containing protein [Bacteroidetes bacterium]|nr:DUF5011 domain-containing protein [Bacteroidota bacterium]MBU1579695.1 DUF5011 domain-containing protein [Bacteroidota bacterium]MBU2465319.1 DUF5011 domain-containing protein [Bacteroidota bacterium]MBU2558956.1 DUF5011 domain-containing protein [Bacteroidota bacterium]
MKSAVFLFVGFFLILMVLLLNSCQKEETSEDPFPPYILLNGANPTWSQLGDAYEDAGARAYDITATRDTIEISARLRQTDNININETGSYRVFYNVTDEAGNEAKEVERVVYVNQFK